MDLNKLIGVIILTLIVLLIPGCGRDRIYSLPSSTFEDLIRNTDQYIEKNELRRYTQGLVIFVRTGYLAVTYPANIGDDNSFGNKDDFILVRDDAKTGNLAVGDIISVVGQLKYLQMDQRNKIIYYLGSNEKSSIEGRLGFENPPEELSSRFQELASNLYYTEPLRDARQNQEDDTIVDRIVPDISNPGNPISPANPNNPISPAYPPHLRR